MITIMYYSGLLTSSALTGFGAADELATRCKNIVIEMNFFDDKPIMVLFFSSSGKSHLPTFQSPPLLKWPEHCEQGPLHPILLKHKQSQKEC